MARTFAAREAAVEDVCLSNRADACTPLARLNRTGSTAGRAQLSVAIRMATSYLATPVRWPGVSPAGIALSVSSPWR